MNRSCQLVFAFALAITLGALSGCGKPAPRSFEVNGVVRELKPDGRTVLIAHDEIRGYMPAMTMPLRARSTNELAGIRAGDAIRFRLVVTAEESWIEGVTKIGSNAPASRGAPERASATATAQAPATNAPPRLADLLADITFTNQSGQPVSWSQFDGQALALTFLFTRCPLPEYCPRLARNFSGASRKLAAMPDAPANWHLIALTFDPEFDSPAVLRAYGQAYGQDTNRWSLLATSPTNTARVAQLFGLNYVREGGTINHDFRTVIIDAAGDVQAVWPIGGDTTDMLVAELTKAARASRAPVKNSPAR